MINLSEKVNWAAEKVVDAGGVSNIQYFETRSVRSVEERCEFVFPELLRDIYESHLGSIKFVWEVPDYKFGDKCSMGYLHLMSPSEIESAFIGQNEFVKDAIRDGMVDENGYSDMIADWPYWIPFCRFHSGDYICFDVRAKKGESDYSVVFLEHDVMDSGPNVHGIRLSSCVAEFMEKWAGLLFVDIYDWSIAVSHDGIDPSLPVFEKLREETGM